MHGGGLAEGIVFFISSGNLEEHAPDVSLRTSVGELCKCHSTCTKKKGPGFCQRKALQQLYLARGQTPPTDALAALIGIPPLTLNTSPVFKMHLINEIGIRKTYADSRYRDRGPLIDKRATHTRTHVSAYVHNAHAQVCLRVGWYMYLEQNSP